jgi:hypothetical protein
MADSHFAVVLAQVKEFRVEWKLIAVVAVLLFWRQDHDEPIRP